MERLGPLFVVGVEATACDADVRAMIEEEQVAGLILFQRNVRQDLPPAEARQVLATFLREVLVCYREAGLPTPFLMIDHEGGRVHRLPGSATRFPPPGHLAALSEPQIAEVCRQQAAELRAIGFNTILGPVLDVCPSTGTQSHIAARAWSGDAERVATLGALAVATLLEAGLLPVPKHFPGYGAAPIDPHLDLPTRHDSLEALRAKDLLPFERVARAGCPALMTAHIVASALDDARPCTLSPAWIRTLRQELGFQGCLVSDDLCMGSVRDRQPAPDLAEATLRAGLDLLLVCHPRPGEIGETRRALEERAEEDAGFGVRTQEALARNAAARDRLAPSTELSPALFEVGERLRQVLSAQGVSWPPEGGQA